MSHPVDLLELIPQPHVVLEPVRNGGGEIIDFTFSAANPAACEINHVPRAQLVGSRLLDLHPNVIRTGLFAKYVDVVRERRGFELVDWGYPQEQMGGQWRYYDVQAVPAGGCVSQMWTDVTDRHEALERLAESERRYRLLAENASDVVFLGSNDGTIEWLSPQTRSIVGVDANDLIGTAFRDLVHPEDRDKVALAHESLLAGRPSTMRRRLLTAGGGFHWVAISAKPLRDDNGVVVGRAGSWTDIADLVAAREEAEAQRAQVRATLDAQIDPFILLGAVRDEQGKIVDLQYWEANEAALLYNHATREELIGSQLLRRYPGQLENGPLKFYFHTIDSGEPTVLDDYAYPNEVLGSERRYDIRAVKCGEAIALTWRDVTDRFRAVEQLAESERRYRLLAENSSDVIWEVAYDGRIEWASESTRVVLGWHLDEVRGRIAIDFVHPDDHSRARQARRDMVGGQSVNTHLRLRRADGSTLWFNLSAAGRDTPEGATRVVAFRDIDAEVTARNELASRIGRDPLTGLMTRDRLEQRLAQELRERGVDRVALLCVGLDSLSRVNDAYTHAAGDVVLAAVAARLLEQIGDPTRVARGTGAEFLVLVLDDAGAPDVTATAERLRRSVREPIDAGEHAITLTASVGIATGEATPREIVRAATLAMRAAKDAGRDQIAFSTQDLADSAQRWLSLAEAVTVGLREAQFVSWLQPIHDLTRGELSGYEALARWSKPDGTIAGPIEFLPVAEHSGLITDIDIAIMRQSLRLMATVDAALFVSLNVSARSLRSQTYEAALGVALGEVGIDPARIHLEVTETDLLHVSDDVVARMHRIAYLGIGWYIDDFGTGYSSISHLRDLPVRGIKLDTSFSAGIQAAEPRSIRLAQALAGLAQGLGLDTVAEGVETDQQLAILAAQGWRYGQGWLFGRPGPTPVSRL